MEYKIVSSKILIEWNDSPKMEVVLNDMPDGLRQDFDDWLATIEDERNEGGILQDRDQQAEDDYWDNHPEEAKRPPIDENLEKVILGAFKKVFPERFTPTNNSDVEVVSEDVRYEIKNVTDVVDHNYHPYVVWDSLTEIEVSPRFPFYEGAENFFKEIRDGKTTLSD